MKQFRGQFFEFKLRPSISSTVRKYVRGSNSEPREG